MKMLGLQLPLNFQPVVRWCQLCCCLELSQMQISSANGKAYCKSKPLSTLLYDPPRKASHCQGQLTPTVQAVNCLNQLRQNLGNFALMMSPIVVVSSQSIQIRMTAQLLHPPRIPIRRI